MRFDSQRRITANEAMTQLPGPEGQRYVELFTHGSLGIEFYAPRGHDPQQPHTRDEAYIIITGSGEYVVEGERQPFGPGDFLFAPAGVAHRFENFTEDLGVWVIFYGPEGGENSRQEQ